ncbi:MAG: M23 family metallopeptidase [Candidatus Aenigmarchaeota archaeon]|nr:M23 family metallopeptidase [Candidatus Aenigmarchaeota archaeon]
MGLKYSLPFPKGVKPVTGAPHGRYAHNGPKFRHATDFVVPPGTPVLAARGGTIYFVKHDSTTYISDMALMDRMTEKELRRFAEKHTNWVTIDNGDGTFAEYVHLDTRQIVRPGQKIRRRQRIGYIGMSGLTTEPHLHFNAVREKRKRKGRKSFESFPVEFSA